MKLKIKYIPILAIWEGVWGLWRFYNYRLERRVVLDLRSDFLRKFRSPLTPFGKHELWKYFDVCPTYRIMNSKFLSGYTDNSTLSFWEIFNNLNVTNKGIVVISKTGDFTYVFLSLSMSWASTLNVPIIYSFCKECSQHTSVHITTKNKLIPVRNLITWKYNKYNVVDTKHFSKSSLFLFFLNGYCSTVVPVKLRLVSHVRNIQVQNSITKFLPVYCDQKCYRVIFEGCFI